MALCNNIEQSCIELIELAALLRQRQQEQDDVEEVASEVAPPQNG